MRQKRGTHFIYSYQWKLENLGNSNIVQLYSVRLCEETVSYGSNPCFSCCVHA